MPAECCRIAPLDDDCVHTIKYVVICARYDHKWIFVRHGERDTWETPGGHIEPGESPLMSAERELYEEAGIKEAELTPLFDYWACDGEGSAWGRLFFARARNIGEIPREYEMAERMLSDILPEKLTYPYIIRKLFPLIQAECDQRGLLQTRRVNP